MVTAVNRCGTPRSTRDQVRDDPLPGRVGWWSVMVLRGPVSGVMAGCVLSLRGRAGVLGR
jgi:hypothetical protein